MSDEEMRKTMQFIIEHQALFAVDIQKLQEGHLRIQAAQQRFDENQERLQESHKKLDEQLRVVAETQAEANQVVTRLAAVTSKGFKETEEKINALIASQMRTEEQQKKTDEQIRKTDENLGRLTDVVERHLREEHGGKEGRGGTSSETA